MSQALLQYDAACHAIATAKTIDEVTDWVDKAAAVREYGRRARNRQLEIDAIEIRVRARKRRGELLLELKQAGQLAEGRKKLSAPADSLPRYTLADLGLTLNESSEDQKIARIDGGAFERLVARCRSYTEAHPEKHSFDVLKPPPESGPINGARSIMGSRQEPDDSLDYFPTPPWATRALIELVLPRVGIGPEVLADTACWDPACGEGHISGVLQEYATCVMASDIHDYSAGGRSPPGWDWTLDGEGETLDFLSKTPPGEMRPLADLIVTNPPFEEKATAFALRALEDARVGVALFVRLQWLETVDRYNAIFRDRPPTLIAFFAERVNLCKGRWDPDGSTATAYVWLVWKRNARRLPPMWIPPGQRLLLERPGDRIRFTMQPVGSLPVVDPASGEIIFDPPETRISGEPPATGGSDEVVQPKAPPETDVTPLAGAAPASADAPAFSSPVENPSATPSPQPVPRAATPREDSRHENDDLEIPAFLRRVA